MYAFFLVKLGDNKDHLLLSGMKYSVEASLKVVRTASRPQAARRGDNGDKCAGNLDPHHWHSTTVDGPFIIPSSPIALISSSRELAHLVE